MRLVRYKKHDPWGALEALHEEMDKLFGRSLTEFPRKDLTEVPVAAALDMWEDDANVYVKADVPGIERKNISLKVKDDTLIISAKKDEVKEENLSSGKAGKKNYYYYERLGQSFYRAVALPASVNTQRVKAQYKDGVLSVTLPKKEEAKEKEIDIAVE